MSDLLPFVIVGVVSGSIYALAAVGLVVTYRTSGVFNLAHGAVAAVGAYAFYELRDRNHLPWPVAALVVLGLLAPLLGLALERLGRLLAGAQEALRVVATVGLLLALTGAIAARYGNVALPFAPYFPSSTFALGDTQIGWDQLLTVIIVGLAVIALQAVFTRTRTGLAMAAVVEDPDLLALSAISPVRTRQTAWVIGSVFATSSGVLIAPTVGLDTTVLTLLVVQAFGAAAVGRFSSIRNAYLGGIGLGIAAAIAQRYLSSSTALQGLPASLPFIVLFGVLALSRPDRFPAVSLGRRSAANAEPWRPSTTMATALVALAFLGAAPLLAGQRIGLFGSWIGLAIIFLSLALLVRVSGQISLCHAAFAAAGATTFHHMSVGLGLPWVVALGLAGAATALVGTAVALPAVRLTGIYLALATFGFGILMQRLAYPLGVLFGDRGVRSIPRPAGFESDTRFYYVALAVLVVCAVAVTVVRAGRFGRVLSALGDAPEALESSGASATTAKLLAFAVSAALAGIGGAVYGASTTSVQSFAGFGFFESITWLTLVAVAGSGLITPALVGAALLTIVPSYVDVAGSENRNIVFGLTAIAVAVIATGRFGLQGKLHASTAAATELRRRHPWRARSGDPGWRSPLGLRRGEASP
jgi:ABC-type branched-subunit amino acid transport system permease subunit